MPGPVKPIPDGYHAVTPYLVVDGAAAAIAFYEKVFGAELVYPPLPAPGGRIGHAELRIGDSIVMLADEHPAEGLRTSRRCRRTSSSGACGPGRAPDVRRWREWPRACNVPAA